MSSFYTDHWQHIEPERLERYEKLFKFRSDQEPIIEALQLSPTAPVLDFGCGPGFLTAEIAQRTGAKVIGADLNAEFITRATNRARKDNLQFVQLSDARLVDQVGQVDRLLCKNVLEYVSDLSETLGSFYDTLSGDGRLLILDSDWGFVLVEPWGKERTDRFFLAASAAFKEPLIGRKLPGALAHAGFVDVEVKVMAGVDRKGRSISVLQNMVSYIREFETMPVDELNKMMDELEGGIDDGTFMFILPQFFVTARRGSSPDADS